MRLLPAFFILFILLVSAAPAKKSVCGTYRDYFGSSFRLNADSTFKYEWHFDTQGDWNCGRWRMKSDTLFLVTIPIYDTLEVYENHKTFDRLVLSGDTISNRVYNDTVRVNGNPLIRPGYELTNQDSARCPIKLLYRHGRFYWIGNNGKPYRKKVKGFWTNKKYPTYFSHTL